MELVSSRMAEMELTGKEDMLELVFIDQDGRVSYSSSRGKEVEQKL